MSAPGHAGDGDRAQAHLLSTGTGGMSHHAPREVLKNELYCVHAYKLAGRSATVPCKALLLLIYIVLWNKRKRDRATGGSTGGVVSMKKELVCSFVRLPATRVYTRAHTFNISACVYVRITMYVH